MSINQVKISARYKTWSTGGFSITAGTCYRVAVTPKNGEYAIGTVMTGFSGDIMEPRLSNGSSYNGNKTAATNPWGDRATVSGGNIPSLKRGREDGLLLSTRVNSP